MNHTNLSKTLTINLKAKKSTISFSLLLLRVFSELKHFPSLTLPPSFLPLALPFPSSLLPFFLPSLLPSFPFFLPPPFVSSSFLPSSLASLLPSSLASFLSSYLPSSLLFLPFASFLPPSFLFLTLAYFLSFFLLFSLSSLLPFLFLPLSLPPFLSLPFFLPCFRTFPSSLPFFHPHLTLCLGDEQFKGNICRLVLFRVGPSAVHKLSLFPSSFTKCVSYLQRWPLDKKIRKFW